RVRHFHLLRPLLVIRQSCSDTAIRAKNVGGRKFHSANVAEWDTNEQIVERQRPWCRSFDVVDIQGYFSVGQRTHYRRILMAITKQDLDAFHQFAEATIADRSTESLHELVEIWEA